MTQTFEQVSASSALNESSAKCLHMSFLKAGTKVGPDQLGPPVWVRSTQIDSDQLGSNKKKTRIIKRKRKFIYLFI